MSENAPTSRRTAGAPPAMIWDGPVPRSSQRRWHLRVYHPALTASQRLELDTFDQAAPLYVAGVPVSVAMAALNGAAALDSPALDVPTLGLAALAAAFAVLAVVLARMWVVRRRPAAAIKKEFALTHPGQRTVRHACLEETQQPAIAAVEAAVTTLSRTGATAQLHQGLWEAADTAFSPLVVAELVKLTP